MLFDIRTLIKDYLIARIKSSDEWIIKDNISCYQVEKFLFLVNSNAINFTHFAHILEIIGNAGKPSSPEIHECMNNT